MTEQEEFDNIAWDVQGEQQQQQQQQPLHPSQLDYPPSDEPAVIDPLSDMNESFMQTLDLKDINSPFDTLPTLDQQHTNTVSQQQDDPLSHSTSLDAALSTTMIPNAVPSSSPSAAAANINTTTAATTTTPTGDNTTNVPTSPLSKQLNKNSKFISVTDPRKENDGQQGTFVSYAIVSKKTTVRRRFQDFVWLYNVLYTHYPACIVPPLPDKHRLEYVKGDRFGTDFVEKRRVSMERFLQRVARHPVLGKAQFFTMFLESSEFNDASARALREGQETMIDSIGDSLLNAFAKIRKPDQQFVDMKERVDRLEENFSVLEKTLTRTNKRTDDLSHDYVELATCIQGLTQLETTCQHTLDTFANAAVEYAKNMAKMTTYDADWLSEIHDYMAYHSAMKDVLKLRDQKQLDFEELTDYLQSTIKEREKTMYPSRTDNGAGYNLTGYLTGKLNEVRGADSEKVRRERVLRLDDRIHELQDAIEQTHEVANAFSDQVKKENEFFVRNNAIEMRDALGTYTDAKVEFYQKGVDLWRNVVQTLEAQDSE